MQETFRSLLELQDLDREITHAEARLAEFGPRLEVVDAPVTTLEREIETMRARLAEMQQHQRKLERNAEEKRERLRRYQERLERVRNAREEAAAKTEIDLIRKAAEADDGEALEVMDQVRRSELKLEELEKKLAHARVEAAPQREDLLRARAEAETALGSLRDRRESGAQRLTPMAARLYERVRGGRTRVVIAGLTADGACGHCYGVIPLQQQAEIREGKSLIRCEACGIILHPGT